MHLAPTPRRTAVRAEKSVDKKKGPDKGPYLIIWVAAPAALRLPGKTSRSLRHGPKAVPAAQRRCLSRSTGASAMGGAPDASTKTCVKPINGPAALCL